MVTSKPANFQYFSWIRRFYAIDTLQVIMLFVIGNHSGFINLRDDVELLNWLASTFIIFVEFCAADVIL